MSAKTIRKQINELELLLEDWITFHGIFDSNSELMSMSSDEFLTLKNNIARRQEILLDLLESEKEVGQMIMDIISRVATTDYVSQLSDIARKRLESEWNSAFICINETIGLLEKRLDHQMSLARPDQFIVQVVQMAGKGIARVFQSTWFKFIFSVVLIGLIIYAVFAFGILSSEDLPSFLRDWLP
ncbi:MAG: hypothetical protein N3A72_11770 [bacterium]|nr:hypothetical protein [bacterium]